MTELEFIEALADWLRGRDEIHELMLAWPPGTKVTSREDAPLMIPAPGLVGVVVSWFENGTVGVEAPMAATLTSPITGYTAEQGQTIRGECDPTRLEILEYDQWTPEDVQAALDLLKEPS